MGRVETFLAAVEVMEDEALESARQTLWMKRNFRFGDDTVVVACLIRAEDMAPLDAPWWHGKQVYLLGVELGGNFFLRHCDGSVRYWDHAKQEDVVIAKSVQEFLSALE